MSLNFLEEVNKTLENKPIVFISMLFLVIIGIITFLILIINLLSSVIEETKNKKEDDNK